MKINQSQLFRLVAEMIFEANQQYEYEIDGVVYHCSPFCCDNINELATELRDEPWNCGGTLNLFKKYFEIDERKSWDGWWDRGDFESRILALLLMSEITKSK